ncbi:MAG: hypothetical protein ABIS92_14100, partial [Polyangia bacterium]
MRKQTVDLTAALVGVRLACLGAALLTMFGCGGGGDQVQTCAIPSAATATPDFLTRLGCPGDFLALSSEPLDSTIPGARSGKVVLDTQDVKVPDGALYFQNSAKYKIHYQFASAHLSGPEHPLVSSLSEFNQVEYYTVGRRFILGAVTHYEGPDIWALEIAPYDTAKPEMIVKLFNKVKAAAYFGAKLVFHPTSDAVEAVARQLPASASIMIKTTNDIFADTDYQPLNLGTTVGKLRAVKAAELDAAYVGFREIVVLDRVPNDISVVAGMITEEFQTPLSHVNVLAQNRGTPNMGLKNATSNSQLRELEGKWVKLTVGSSSWKIAEATQDEADIFWEAHKPAAIQVPALDLAQTDLKDIQDVVDESPGTGTLKQQIQKAITAYGTKASNYSVLAKTTGVPIRPAFGIPVYYYV